MLYEVKALPVFDMINLEMVQIVSKQWGAEDEESRQYVEVSKLSGGDTYSAPLDRLFYCGTPTGTRDAHCQGWGAASIYMNINACLLSSLVYTPREVDRRFVQMVRDLQPIISDWSTEFVAAFEKGLGEHAALVKINAELYNEIYEFANTSQAGP
jgi:hypothetical protein